MLGVHHWDCWDCTSAIAGVCYARFLLTASLHFLHIFTKSWDEEYSYHGKSQRDNIRLFPSTTKHRWCKGEQKGLTGFTMKENLFWILIKCEESPLARCRSWGSIRLMRCLRRLLDTRSLPFTIYQRVLHGCVWLLRYLDVFTLYKYMWKWSCQSERMNALIC
jgi:hypothetical protein